MKKFYRDKETNEVYELVETKLNKVKVNHTVRDIAWVYASQKDFENEMTLCTGRDHCRVEILADVIAQLNMNKFIAKANDSVYVNLSKDGEDYSLEEITFYSKQPKLVNELYPELAKGLYPISPKDKVCDLRSKLGANSCTVCAIGALFMSMIDIHDKLSLNKFNKLSNQSNDEIGGVYTSYLKKYFPINETRAMEFAFEGYKAGKTDISHSVIYNFRKDIFNKFSKAFIDNSYILKEIIANTLKFGKFSPSKGLA